MIANAPPPANREQRGYFPLAAFAFWILGGLIGIALCAAWVRSISISPQYGSFTWLDAPNQAFTAEARTTRKKWFWGGMREYFEFTIAKFDRVRQQYDPNCPWHYPPERTIILDRIEGLAFPFERGAEACKVEWAADASEVTFDLDGAKVSISTKGL